MIKHEFYSRRARRRCNFCHVCCVHIQCRWNTTDICSTDQILDLRRVEISAFVFDAEKKNDHLLLSCCSLIMRVNITNTSGTALLELSFFFFFLPLYNLIVYYYKVLTLATACKTFTVAGLRWHAGRASGAVGQPVLVEKLLVSRGIRQCSIYYTLLH